MLGTLEQRIKEMLGFFWLTSRTKFLVLLRRKPKGIWLCIWDDKVSKQNMKENIMEIYVPIHSYSLATA